LGRVLPLYEGTLRGINFKRPTKFQATHQILNAVGETEGKVRNFHPRIIRIATPPGRKFGPPDGRFRSKSRDFDRSCRGTPCNFFFRIYAKLTKKGSSHDMRRRTSGLVAIVKNPRDTMEAEMRNFPSTGAPIRGTDERKMTYPTKKKLVSGLK